LQVFIVRDGKVAWQYTHPKPEGRQGGGEISDAAYLPDGNVIIAYQYGVAIISPEKKVVWETKAEPGCEIHTAQWLGNNRVMYVQNGDPAKLRVVNTQSGAVEKELTLATGNPKSVHLQFRRARVLHAGEMGETFLIGHMDLNKVVEYDGDGKELWKVEIPSPWSALRLKNGNTLIASNRNFVREVDAKGETVWEFRQADVPEYRIFGTQTAVRLANGNTIINNWRTPAGGNYPVQFIEVTPEKKVVWAVREWGVGGGPNFGASTTVQLLDEPE
jgi:outer membrane protein assembly factor BamB